MAAICTGNRAAQWGIDTGIRARRRIGFAAEPSLYLLIGSKLTDCHACLGAGKHPTQAFRHSPSM